MGARMGGMPKWGAVDLEFIFVCSPVDDKTDEPLGEYDPLLEGHGAPISEKSRWNDSTFGDFFEVLSKAESFLRKNTLKLYVWYPSVIHQFYHSLVVRLCFFSAGYSIHDRKAALECCDKLFTFKQECKNHHYHHLLCCLTRSMAERTIIWMTKRWTWCLWPNMRNLLLTQPSQPCLPVNALASQPTYIRARVSSCL